MRPTRTGSAPGPGRRPPAVDAVLRAPALAELRGRFPAGALRSAARAAVGASRGSGELASASELAQVAAAQLERERGPELRRVINATGVALHTNLGRSVLSPAALAAALLAGSGSTDLEIALDSGERADRQRLVTGRLRQLTGAAAALVVNNNAAAVLLALAALARGREVIVSRGEQVEIGGSFRLPEVVRQSGARLVEVGTTNRTRLQDYADACGSRTAAILRVHPSNYRVVGFTERPSLADLAGLAGERGLPLLDDMGSGCLFSGAELAGLDLGDEPVVQEELQDGADLVCFSGDKLMGGPQCGVLLGRTELVARCSRHPLARAVRIDKLSLAALQVTLDAYLAGRAQGELPLWRTLTATAPSLRRRAQQWAAALTEMAAAAGARLEVVASRSPIGGGSSPGLALDSSALRVSWPGRGGRPASGRAEELAARLRRQDPAVLARVHEGAVWCDPRAVLLAEDDAVVSALRRALEG